MKFAFIDAEKATWPVDVMCDVLGVSRSGFYAWKARPISDHATKDAQLAVEISVCHRRSRSTYGSPRIHADLQARGIHVGKKRVERLLREPLAAKNHLTSAPCWTECAAIRRLYSHSSQPPCLPPRKPYAWSITSIISPPQTSAPAAAAV